jgi:hypothetical protein
MIVYDEGPTLRLITQPDHAHFAGALLSLWIADGLPSHPRRAEILYAAREHDNGWREADSAPRCDPRSRRPYDFLTLPPTDRIEIWQRGAARFAGSHPYAALLITRHALQLHRDREDDYSELLDFLAELERGLLEETDVPESKVAADSRLLGIVDLLSLAACQRRDEPFERSGVKGRFADGALHLDPFPLAGTTAFTVPCRRIPNRDYRGDADLGGELAAARWGELTVRVIGA